MEVFQHMDNDYFLLLGALAVGAFLLLVSMYLIYRRGIATRITLISTGCMVIVGALAFMPGKEGITLGKAAIALFSAVPLILGLLSLMVRHIVNPTQRIAEVATAVARGEVDQNIEIARQDELGELADAFRRLIRYMQEMASAARHLAEGDLTVKVTPLSEHDILGHAFAEMIADLRYLIGQVIDSANTLGAASNQLMATADQVAQAIDQVATTIQQVASGTLQQTESVTGTRMTVDQVVRTIDNVARGAHEQAVAVGQSAEITARISAAIQLVTANAQASAASTAQAAQTARTGVETAENTVTGIRSIKTSSDLVARRIADMGQSSEEIGAIVETIDDIAAQTNLLALNAAIEAARAGEHGKGFAVVADEVRKLAENAAGATQKIASLIKNIQGTIASAMQAMEEGSRQVEAGVTRANEARQVLDAILVAAEAANQQVGRIAAATGEMDTSSNELVGAMDSVSAVVEENTAATEEMSASAGLVSEAIENIAAIAEGNNVASEEVSAAVEEVNAQVEEVTASAQSLAAMAQQLQALVAQFRLSDGQAEERARKYTDRDAEWGTVRAPSVSLSYEGRGFLESLSQPE
jgi:methyl-accepting chemotaxis protein